MDTNKAILYFAVFIIFLAITKSNASPIALSSGSKTTTERYFGEVMNELNVALKEKNVEEKKHISLLLNITEEMKELSIQVKGMQMKLEKVAGE